MLIQNQDFWRKEEGMLIIANKSFMSITIFSKDFHVQMQLDFYNKECPFVSDTNNRILTVLSTFVCSFCSFFRYLVF